jgi:hypothetical protein
VSPLTLSLLMSYIYRAPSKARNFNAVYIYIYIDLRLASLKAVSFSLLHNVSTLNQCSKFSCVTVVRKHFVSYQDYPNYRWDLTFRNRASIYKTGTPLPSEHPILFYFFSTNIRTEFFKHAAHFPFFSLQNAVYFIMLPFLAPVLFAFYIQVVLKFKCQILVPKG